MRKKCQINKILFYFISELNIEKTISLKTINNRKNENVSIWKNNFDISNEVLYDLKRLFNYSESNHILSTFILDKNYYRVYGLNFINSYLLPKNNLNKIGFKLNDVKIHCYNSNINFLELDYEIDSNDINDINNFNYFLSEIKSNVKLELIYKKYIQNSEVRLEKKIITVLDFINNILSDFERINDMDYNNGLTYKSLKPLLFTYLLDDESNGEYEVNIGHNYKESYQLNEKYVKRTKYFNNSTWYYTSDSISNISHLTKNDVTNVFFQTTFKDKLNKLYFLLTLYAYHQKIYLLDTYHKLISFNLKYENAFDLENKRNEIALLISNFKKMSLYYFLETPSFIEHVNLFYRNVYDTFSISSYKKMVEEKMELLRDFSTQCTTILVDYSNKKEAKRMIVYDIFAIFTASIVSFASLYDSFLKFLGNINVDLDAELNLIIFLIFVLLCLFIPLIYNLIKNIKKLRKGKKDIIEAEKKMKDFDFIN